MPAPLHTFRFGVYVRHTHLSQQSTDASPSIRAGFAECQGLEATMEPKVIKEGGRAYGAVQRVGAVTFATVVLKRGISQGGELFEWFHRVATEGFGRRAEVEIELLDTAGELVMTWTLANAMPTKFKAADFNARASEVGIEELHLAHEGLSLRFPEAR